MRDDIKLDGKAPERPRHPLLDTLTYLLPPPMVGAHALVPRQLWRDFREVALLHHRTAAEEMRQVLQEHVRRYRVDLESRRRRIARGEEDLDYGKIKLR